MNSIVLYYSLRGFTGFIAREISKELGADLIRIETLDEFDSSDPTRYYQGDKEDNYKERAPIKGVDADPESYDLVVIGTPVWYWSPASPICSYIGGAGPIRKRTALFLTSDGDLGPAMDRLKGLLVDSNIISTRSFKNDPIGDRGLTAKKARSWARGLVQL